MYELIPDEVERLDGVVFETLRFHATDSGVTLCDRALEPNIADILLTREEKTWLVRVLREEQHRWVDHDRGTAFERWMGTQDCGLPFVKQDRGCIIFNATGFQKPPEPLTRDFLTALGEAITVVHSGSVADFASAEPQGADAFTINWGFLGEVLRKKKLTRTEGNRVIGVLLNADSRLDADDAKICLSHCNLNRGDIMWDGAQKVVFTNGQCVDSAHRHRDLGKVVSQFRLSGQDEDALHVCQWAHPDFEPQELEDVFRRAALESMMTWLWNLLFLPDAADQWQAFYEEDGKAAGLIKA